MIHFYRLGPDTAFVKIKFYHVRSRRISPNLLFSDFRVKHVKQAFPTFLCRDLYQKIKVVKWYQFHLFDFEYGMHFAFDTGVALDDTDVSYS